MSPHNNFYAGGIEPRHKGPDIDELGVNVQKYATMDIVPSIKLKFNRFDEYSLQSLLILWARVHTIHKQSGQF